ncbi:MAG: NfeD family protein [Gemmatimonadales bacterium]
MLRRATLLSLVLGATALVPGDGRALAAQDVVFRVAVTGTIENGLAPYIARAIREANAGGAKAVLLDIDTPGGRIDAAERIVDAVRASAVPVFAFVNPRAYSAGAMIALAAGGGIYIREGGVIGAATPVDGQGTKASEKMVSAMRGEFRALAEANGYDPQLAEGMVDETLDIPDVKPAGQLLTLTATEAVGHGFAKAIAPDLGAVLAAEGFSGAAVETVGINWAESVVRFLTNPMVAPLLLSLGMLGLVFEVKAGQFGVGALVSVSSLGLFFGSHVLLGLAGWEEVILLGLGLLAVGVEVFLLPGFGVAGVLGGLLLGGAVVLSLLGAAPTVNDFVQAGAVIGAALVISASVFIAWLRHLPNSSRFKGLFLKDSTGKDEGFISAPMRADLIGKTGSALTDLRPSGVALVDGERLDVVTEGDFIKSGAPVKVLRSDGYRLIVRAADALPPV